MNMLYYIDWGKLIEGGFDGIIGELLFMLDLDFLV